MIPFIAVGWYCAVPNLNLADGMLAYLSMMIGFIVLQFHRDSGLAIVAGAAAGFYLSALEMRMTGRSWDSGAGASSHDGSQGRKPADGRD